MEGYIWLFPVLFIVHDMEEIIGFKRWFEKNKTMLDTRFPRISKTYKLYSTEGMALAVLEELILCIAICLISLAFNWYGLWLGGFIAYGIHLVIHVVQSVIIKKYIPALITSLIALPVSVWLIKDSISILNYSKEWIVLYSVIGSVVVALNLKLAHMLMHRFTKWMV